MNIKFVLSTVALLLCILNINLAQTSPLLQKGDPAPNFSEIDDKGNSISLDDYSGKVVLLKFTATWCGPCWEVYTPMHELQKRYGDDLVIISFHMDEMREKWEKKAASKGINFDVVSIWKSDTKQDVFNLFSPKIYPNFVLLDQNGVITKKWEGNSEKYLRRYVHQAMRRAKN